MHSETRAALSDAAEAAIRARCCGGPASSSAGAIVDTLRSLRERGQGFDVALQCGGETVRCHSVALAAQGDFWRTLCFGPMARRVYD